MTKQEKTAKLSEIQASVEEKVEAYNEAVLNANHDEVVNIDNEISELVNKYTSVARDIVFDECAETENPMLEAVKRLVFTTIGVKDTKQDDGGIPVRSVISRERQIDLYKLHKRVEGGIGNNKNWNDMIEKFNLLMTCQKAKDLGINPTSINDSYAMSNTARQYDIGKNPASKTNLLKTVTEIVAAMIGEEYKPVSHDVNFLLSIYSRKSRKALTVSCANHKYLRGYMMEICHRLVTGKSYDVDYKMIRKND